MAIDTSVPRSRRALLAGGIGGAAALAASALGQPQRARAGTDGDVVLGAYNKATSTTTIENSTEGGAAVGAWSTGDGCGLVGQSGAVLGPVITVPAKAGVFGYAAQDSKSIGMAGRSVAGTGVSGGSESGTGVAGLCDTGIGVLGHSQSGVGITGSSSYDIGVDGWSGSTMKAAIVGASGGDNTGVHGHSGDIAGPSPARTGVYGYAVQDAASRGVHGRSTAGRGVYGQATNGVGSYGYASSGTGVVAATTTGYALRTSGRLKVDKASGVATIAAGTSSVVVAPGLDVTSASFVLLTPRGDPGNRRLWYATNPTTDDFVIRVSSAVTADLKVGWLLLG